MPASGGKAYLLLVEDIKALAETDEYRLDKFFIICFFVMTFSLLHQNCNFFFVFLFFVEIIRV